MAKTTKTAEFTTKEFHVYFPFETKDVACPDCGAMPCICEGAAGKTIKIQGYANFCKDASSETDVFVDHCGDVMVPEGFDLSVWNKNPQVLWQHDRDYTIGKGLQAVKQKDGLVVTCEIHEKAMEPKDFYKIDQGLVSMFSVGFRTLKGEWKVINDREVFFITKALLYEVSVVSIPMNSESQFTRIKSLDDGSFSAGDFTFSPEDSSAKSAVNKTVSEDRVKQTLREMLPEDKVKEIEALGMGASLDELQEVDTKSYIEVLVTKVIQAEIAKALEVFKAEMVKSTEVETEETPEGELPASEEETEVAPEATEEEIAAAEAVAAEEEKALQEDAVKVLSAAVAASLKALVEEK